MPSKLSTVYVPPPIAVKGLAVSPAEVDYFKSNGFLYKSSLLEQAAVEASLTKVWEALVECVPMSDDCGPVLSRDDPTSWQNPKWKPPEEADKSGFFEERQRFAIHGRTVKMHDIGNELYLLDLVPHNTKVKEVANQLLSDSLKRVERTRGVYAFFPSSLVSESDRQQRVSGNALGPHTDRVCQQLNVCAYLDDVPPRSGGFTAYPGSHKVMFEAHQYESNWSPNARFKDCMREVIETIAPVEFAGKRGDVVFWHGRTVHSAGIHVGDTIRWALFSDYTQDRPYLTPDEHREMGQYEWFKDTKLFRNDDLVSDDMWRNWRLEPSLPQD